MTDIIIIIIYLVHLLLIVPFLFFIGVKGDKAPSGAFGALLMLAVFTALYHSSGLVYSLWTGKGLFLFSGY